jgi:hypothetical protein
VPRRPAPDFIVIGAMKCATSTLHEQLAAQPGFFMSRPKEPNFFSDDDVYARGMDWYQGLFAEAPPGTLCGESSTHYTKLPTHPDALPRLAEALGPRRFVYVMRHPIDRLVSHYIHEWTQRSIELPIDEAVQRHPELVDYGCYAMQLRPWFERFGREAVLPVFFERLAAAPDAELLRVARFVGSEETVRFQPDLGAQNVSRDRLRKSPLRDALMHLPGATALRRALVPRRVRDRIKERWQMRDRPELSATPRAAVTQRFDEDLAALGSWLGTPLDCASFTETVRARTLDWYPRDRFEASD